MLLFSWMSTLHVCTCLSIRSPQRTASRIKTRVPEQNWGLGVCVVCWRWMLGGFSYLERLKKVQTTSAVQLYNAKLGWHRIGCPGFAMYLVPVHRHSGNDAILSHPILSNYIGFTVIFEDVTSQDDDKHLYLFPIFYTRASALRKKNGQILGYPILGYPSFTLQCTLCTRLAFIDYASRISAEFTLSSIYWQLPPEFEQNILFSGRIFF